MPVSPGQSDEQRAGELTQTCLPISAGRAKSIGLIDHVFSYDVDSFRERVRRLAETIAGADDIAERLARKQASRHYEERLRPLDGYRYDELARMRHDFSSAGYERARQVFVHKTPQEPFSHPAAIGPVIRSTRHQAARDRKPIERWLVDFATRRALLGGKRKRTGDPSHV